MLKNVIFDNSSATYNDKIIIIDTLNFEKKIRYSEKFEEHGFQVIHYENDLIFRSNHDTKVIDATIKLLIIVGDYEYIPYDILCKCVTWKLTCEAIFPKLNSNILTDSSALQLDLISLAYEMVFNDCKTREKTNLFLSENVYNKHNISKYLNLKYQELLQILKKTQTYYDWFLVVEKKARIDSIASKYGCEADTSEVNHKFQNYILENFGNLSHQLNTDTPVIVSKTMEFISENSRRFILIVMDGMSEFDWSILSSDFEDIVYEKTSVYAMIPTTTAISRQCLLANKYPKQLKNPWSLSKEKQEFIECAKNLGFLTNQIGYGRGYDTTFNVSVRCGVVIINDIDDLAHTQLQGRCGMYQDIELLAQQKKLSQTTRRFLSLGYDVFITSDHGNSAAIGLGKLVGTGVEVETKSKKMLVLKDFADKKSLIEKFGMIDYPKYYLDKKLDYLICDIGTSLDKKGSHVITHGGISIDEVIVPFITVKSEVNNG